MQIVDLIVDPDHMGDAQMIRSLALARAGLRDDGQLRVRVTRRSIDARSKMPRFLLRVAVGGEDPVRTCFRPRPLGGKRVVVVGAGPGGYFAALTLLEAGVKRREGKKHEQEYKLNPAGEPFAPELEAFKAAVAEEGIEPAALLALEGEALAEKLNDIRTRMGLVAGQRQRDVLNFVAYLAAKA